MVEYVVQPDDDAFDKDYSREIRIHRPSSPGFKGRTTAQDDYGAKPLATFDGRLLVGREQDRPVYRANPVHMSYATTAKDDYPGWPVKAPQPSPRTAAPRAVQPLTGRSVTHDDFKQHPLPVRQAAAPTPRSVWKPSKFEGQSTTAASYPPHRIEPFEQLRPSTTPPLPSPRVRTAPVKFEGRSQSHDDYQAKPLPTRELASPRAHVPHQCKFEGRSTHQDAYIAWPVEAKWATPPAAPPSPHVIRNPVKFEGESVTHADFQPHALSTRDRLPPSKPQYHPTHAKFDGRTTHQDAFQRIALPARVASLGVEVETGTVPGGGKFYPLIEAAEPPARGSAVFTTTKDMQTEVVIKALCSTAGRALVCLGSFEMTGIAPNPMGVAQIEVTFTLDAARELVVSAVDHADKVRRSLAIKPKHGSPLLPEAQRLNGVVELS